MGGCNRKDDKVWAQGTFKNVWRGEYNLGPDAGKPCVIKEFKTGSVYEDHYYDDEMNVLARTRDIIDSFNAARITSIPVTLLIPEIWRSHHDSSKAMIEPMINKFEKFNSNSGWVPEKTNVFIEAMQALSHFSYHSTNGRFLLCDVQGGATSAGLILTDPIVMSETENRYGPGDLGPEGVKSWFKHHKCTRYCSKSWIKPEAVKKAKIAKRKGTTFTPHGPKGKVGNVLDRIVNKLKK